MGLLVAEELSYEECRAWAEKYAETPFVHLPLVTAAARDPSPARVMHSLLAQVERLRAVLYMPAANGAPTLRIYWGCTTFGCARGFHGTEEDMPRDWKFCPSCAGDLTEITSRRGASAKGETDVG